MEPPPDDIMAGPVHELSKKEGLKSFKLPKRTASRTAMKGQTKGMMKRARPSAAPVEEATASDLNP
jgi:hypothetical protein